MRVHLIAVAVAAAAVATAALLLRRGGETAPAMDAGSGSALRSTSPPTLERTAAAPALPQDPSESDDGEHGTRLRVRATPGVARDWTLDVVDESGSAVDALGLLSVIIRSADVRKFESSIAGERISIPEVDERDTVRIVRNFPERVGGADAFGTDIAQVRASSILVRVMLGGWTPVEVVLPEPDTESSSPRHDYVDVHYNTGDADQFRWMSRGSHAIPVRFRRRVTYAEWYRTSVGRVGPSRRGALDVTTNPNVFTWTATEGR